MKYILLFILCNIPIYSFNINLGSTGLLFPYTLGALAYIKTHIKPTNYNFVGISGGTWCSLIYHFEKNITDHDQLWSILIGNKNYTISMLDNNNMQNFQQIVSTNMKNRYKNKNIINMPISIITTKINNDKCIESIKITKFKDIDDLVNFCLCSSYIPYISGKSLYMEYNNDKYIDGELFKNNNNFLKNALLINKNTWKRKFTFRERIYLDYNQSAKLFEYGWKDAEQNL